MTHEDRMSLVFGSDEDTGPQCDCCHSDGKHTDAVSFCVDCGSNFCPTCITWHAKFQGTSGHRISDLDVKSQLSKSLPRSILQESPYQNLPRRAASDKERRPRSSEKGRTNSPPELPPRPPQKTNYSKQNPMLGKLEQLRNSRLDQLEQVKHDERNNFELVKKLTDKISDLVTEECIAKHEQMKNNLSDEIELLENCIQSINKGVGDDSCNQDIVRQLEQSQSQSLESTLISRLKDFLVELEDHTRPEMSVEFLREYNVSMPGDQSVCGIYASCLLENGMLVLADNANKRIKLLDRKTGSCILCLDVPCGPWGVCSTRLNEVAVTLTNEQTVVFLSVGKQSIVTTRSFAVKEFCRGICHQNGNLYVTCGSLNHMDSGFVGVFDLNGQLHRKISWDPAGRQIFSLPHHVAATPGGERIYIADKNHGAIIIAQDDSIVEFKDENLIKAFGICVLERNGFLVSGINSDTVVHVDDNGKKIKTLLSVADGIYGPYSLLIDNTDSSLIVTFYKSNVVKVYKIAS